MNNPPAFPVFPETAGGHAAAWQGMSLRDYFAAQCFSSLNLGINMTDDWYAKTTKHAYKMADAMMKAREA